MPQSQGAGEASMNTADARPVKRDEAQMIAAILAGDRELYHTLIQPYEFSVYRMALSFVKNETEAEDVAQEAFLKAFRDLANFRGESKFSTWLISITLNEARRRLRRQNTIRMESLDEPPGEGGRVSPALLRDWREIPSEALERREVRALLQKAIEELAPIYREVLVLRDIEELSVEETASALAISISSVKVRLHRARIMLQKELAPKLNLAIPKKRRWLSWY
jgi:RNA polymerase sigma-70 factor, ECF subfamily